MRLVFRLLQTARALPVRVGHTRDGWAAVTDGGALVALAPSRQGTLALARRLRLTLAKGRPGRASVAIACGTAFQLRVWRACRAIPPGRTLTYGALARRLGLRSARAVGQALARNPLSRLIPCHRVVARGGDGGFAWGAGLKRRWLRMEHR